MYMQVKARMKAYKKQLFNLMVSDLEYLASWFIKFCGNLTALFPEQHFEYPK